MFTVTTTTGAEFTARTLAAIRDEVAFRDAVPVSLSIADCNDLAIPMGAEQLADEDGAYHRVEIARGAYAAADDAGTIQSRDLEAISHALWLRCGGGATTVRAAFERI